MGWPPDGVKPLPKHKRAEPARARPSPQPRQTRLDEKAVLAESLGPASIDDLLDSGDELAYVRHSHSRDLLRKLRRGHWQVQDELDLHGLNRRDAWQLVLEFLKASHRRGLRCLRIVHGKGLGSPQRLPVLKALLRKKLPELPEVLAFSQAPAASGGSGAVLVLLGA